MTLLMCVDIAVLATIVGAATGAAAVTYCFRVWKA
jgi:hypothetical protein